MSNALYPDPVADKREGKYTMRNLFINIDRLYISLKLINKIAPYLLRKYLRNVRSYNLL